jgi:hypothetical protein
MKVVTGEYSSYTNNLIEEHKASKVWLWDCGPEEPILPDEPEPPAVTLGDPKYHLAILQHKRAVKHYEEELIRFEEREKEFKHWHANIKGPVETIHWSCDARDALNNDQRAVAEGRQKKRRYFISSQTRGYEKTRNMGLPPGVEPGEGHRENMERQLAGDKAFVEILKADPQFGQEITP